MLSETAAHPRAPGPAAQTFTLQQRFSVGPDVLWPFVSDTDRINRAAGISEAKGTYEPADSGRVLIGRAKQLGFTLEWVEHPFEHIAGERLGVLREYRTGPVLWVRSVVVLAQTDDGGTQLTQTFEAQPRSLMFAPVVAAEIGVRLKRAFQRTYRELEQFLSLPIDQRPLDGPFATWEPLGTNAERELARGLSAMHERGIGAYPLAVLEQAIRGGDPMELGRLRPLELAWRSGAQEDDMVDACLIGADVGLLQLRWEVLCPHCRVSAQALEKPEQLDAPGWCEACGVAIGVDPLSSVEAVFRPNPLVREVETGTFCLGAPAHLPHVVAQQVVAPGEQLQLKLRLASGAWAVTAGPSLTVELDVVEGAPSAEATVSLSKPEPRLTLSSKAQLLIISNDTAEPQRVRVESGVMRATVLTAARAAARASELVS